jgi:sporulation protein YlmC with PRC-barrel domain
MLKEICREGKNMMMNYKMIGNDLYDYRSQKIAIVKGGDIYNTHSQKVGVVKDNDVYDDRYRKLISLRGMDIFDEHNTRIGSMIDIKRMVEGNVNSNILLGLWYFFIRTAS